MNWFLSLDNITQAFIATTFAWLMTMAGASLVFFFKTVNRKFLNANLGFAAGVMIAASFWSLLAPAIEMSEANGIPGWIPALTGFLSGGLFLLMMAKFLNFLDFEIPKHITHGDKKAWHRSLLLIFSITIHNIPEGLAIGVAFGALSQTSEPSAIAGAIALAIGIGIQDFPEGTAVSIPLRREGFSRIRAFWYGQLSGIVEIFSGVAGALLVVYVEAILPFALSFAAGAMMFVVIKELIPESQEEKDHNLATYGAMLGFAVMMTLDVAFG